MWLGAFTWMTNALIATFVARPRLLIFTRDDDGGHTYVLKQPETPEEDALCKEAMEGCPVEAIGNDGA